MPKSKAMALRYPRSAQIVIFALALLIVLYSIYLIRYDSWIDDLFYFTTFFSLVIALDYFFYSIKSQALVNRSHTIFCLFPVRRLKIIFYEFSGYITRIEILAFILATLWLISTFYLQNETGIFRLILALSLYILQILYLILFLILVKNISNSFRDFISTFISVIILLTVFSSENTILWRIFITNPFCNGFLSFLLDKNAILLGYGFLVFTTILMVFIANYNLKSWPLSKTPSNFL